MLAPRVAASLPGSLALTGTTQRRTAASSSSEARRRRPSCGLESSSILGVFSMTENRRRSSSSFPHHFGFMFLFSVRMRESFGLHTATVLVGERRDAVCDTLRTVIRGGAKDSGASGRVGRGCALVCACVCLTCRLQSLLVNAQIKMHASLNRPQTCFPDYDYICMRMVG